MQNLQISQEIVIRFHEALQRLIEDKGIAGKQTFARKYVINKRKLYYSAAHPEAGAFEVGWLTYLIKDFNVSSEYLLFGKGSFYKKQRAKRLPKLTHPDIIT